MTVSEFMKTQTKRGDLVVFVSNGYQVGWTRCGYDHLIYTNFDWLLPMQVINCLIDPTCSLAEKVMIVEVSK